MNNNIKVLIVEDEDKMRNVIKIYLKKEGYSVKEAENGKMAIEMIENEEFTLVLLDIMLPMVDGWKVCKIIRKQSNVPIIMLSARGEEYDKLLGFELGVDDYITKPFSPKEMIARIRAVLKRCNILNMENDDIITQANLRIDPVEKRAFVCENEMKLTPKEFEILNFLAHNPQRVYSREELLNTIWGYDFFGDVRTVDTHIKQIREKLGDNRDYIHTVWGSGYKFKVVENEDKN